MKTFRIPTHLPIFGKLRNTAIFFVTENSKAEAINWLKEATGVESISARNSTLRDDIEVVELMSDKPCIHIRYHGFGEPIRKYYWKAK